MKRPEHPSTPPRAPVGCEICILAGGLSSRMGQNKARLRLGGRSLLARIRETAARLPTPVRIIRRDLIPRCGPLGGVYTALRTSRHELVLFLSCDMPFVSERLLRALLQGLRANARGLFVALDGVVGFPFLLRTDALPVVTRQCVEKRLSLQDLAKTLRADSFQPEWAAPVELFNVNTPEEWEEARRLWRGLRDDRSDSTLLSS